MVTADQICFAGSGLPVQWWVLYSGYGNAEVLQKTSLSTISEILCNRRLSLFGHVARLDSEVPANKALLLMVNSHESRKSSTSWTRPPGHPRHTWLNLVKEDANAIPLSSLWRTEIFRGHGAVQRSVRTTWRWWWRWYRKMTRCE